MVAKPFGDWEKCAIINGFDRVLFSVQCEPDQPKSGRTGKSLLPYNFDWEYAYLIHFRSLLILLTAPRRNWISSSVRDFSEDLCRMISTSALAAGGD